LANQLEQSPSRLSKLVYAGALAAALSIWTLSLRAPLWLDETLAYWQVSGGFGKVWSRSALMPSSIGYLYTLCAARSVLGSSEMALKIPSLVALLGAVYFLFRGVREFFGTEMAFLATVFFALHYNVVFAATDARPYAFALLATTLAIDAFTRWMKRGTMRDAVLFGAAAAGILYFHYLFGSILPAFAIYYLAARYRSLRHDARQLAAVLVTFGVLIIPLVVRVAGLYLTRGTHIVQAVHHPVLLSLNTLAPLQLVIGFLAAMFLAALVRKVKLPGRESWPAALLVLLLGLVPAAILCVLDAATPMNVIQPRYFVVVAPGSAMIWAWLTSSIDSRLLRQIFCVGLVAVTVFEAYRSPASRRHEINFKQAHAFVNRNAAADNAPVLVFSAFIESDYEPLPHAPGSENALLSQIDYYPIHQPWIFLPIDLNQKTKQIAGQAVLTAAGRHQRFIAVVPPSSYPSLDWLAEYTRGTFTAQTLGLFDREIMVVEFRPLE
jgi:4-amino-4-deoxy-L-arabinose transferase-like glycosyltransferase